MNVARSKGLWGRSALVSGALAHCGMGSNGCPLMCSLVRWMASIRTVTGCPCSLWHGHQWMPIDVLVGALDGVDPYCDRVSLLTVAWASMDAHRCARWCAGWRQPIL
eukprot:1160453-Pelagomonas_calceolata.AAC.14